MDNLIKVADGFHFLEGPRWHENKLWFSDMHGYKVTILMLMEIYLLSQKYQNNLLDLDGYRMGV